MSRADKRLAFLSALEAFPSIEATIAFVPGLLDDRAVLLKPAIGVIGAEKKIFNKISHTAYMHI